MMEPLGEGSEFKMVWDGDDWQIYIKGFNIIDVKDLAGLGQDLSQMVSRAFNERAGRHVKQKFKGNI